jgi:Sulfotransferase family
MREQEPRLSLADWRHAERLFHSRRETLVPVREPMVLISQIQRSGGTLLNSLLDGHPELHVHPWEIQIGHPTKYEWPRLDLDTGADAWLEILGQTWLPRAFEAGYRKDRPGEPLAEGSLPVLIPPSFVESLFRVLVAGDPPRTQRDVLDCYFTAFFNAWLDCQGLWDRPKKWLAGFCPRLAWGESGARWRADYPDGRLVAVVRDPRGWYASARAYDRRYRDLDSAVALWRNGAEEIASAKHRFPDDVLVLTYEQLVTEPEPVTRSLAAWLGIDWAPSLLDPTFNRRPVPPDSSFEIPTGGVRTESLERWQTELDDTERAVIEELALPAYRALSSSA